MIQDFAKKPFLKNHQAPVTYPEPVEFKEEFAGYDINKDDEFIGYNLEK